MKTFKKLRDDLITHGSLDADYDAIPITEASLRQIGGVALAMKVRSIHQQISRIKFSIRDDPAEQRKKLMLQNGLIGKQNYFIGLLVAQLGVMSRQTGDSK